MTRHPNEEPEDMLFPEDPETAAQAWLAEGRQDFPVSDSFVGSTLRHVLADQEEIRQEAARVDDVQLPKALLDALRPPKPAADFVEATHDRVRADAEREHANAAQLRDALPQLVVPAHAPDFVARTLAAIEDDETVAADNTVAAHSATPGTGNRFSWRAMAAAAAILLLVPLGILAFQEPPQQNRTSDQQVARHDQQPEPQLAATFSTVMAADSDRRSAVTPIAFGRGLVHLARMGNNTFGRRGARQR